MSLCRICQSNMGDSPLLSYSSMPAQAQYLPENPGTPGVDLRLFECPACGVLQLDCPPVPYFREVIRAVGVSEEMKKFRLEQFSNWLQKYGLAGKKILECGCGKGEYLDLMRQSGAEVYGMEYSDENISAAAAQGLNVEKCYFNSGEEKLSSALFDGFFILNYLEHIPDLKSYLAGICANLAPGGYGLVEVPNFDMMIKEKLFAEFTSDHLYYFTEKTLRNLLENNGFEVLSCQSVWHNYIISAEVRKRLPFDPSPFTGAEKGLRNQLEKFISGYAPEDIAVWGAGHQSFAVLAWAGLSSKIRFVIDSAPFKQGKFIPAGTAKIVSPEVLKDSSLKAILIMAGSYSEEIAGIIRNRYGKRYRIGILRANEVVEA